MNLKPLFAIPLVLSALCASAVGVSTFNYEFAENSRLTSGHWVRVSVDRTGIYEISYDRLRELGFSNPYLDAEAECSAIILLMAEESVSWRMT